MAGLAFAEQAPVMTADYLADERFETTPEIEAFVREAGIRAVIAAPLIGEDAGPLGVLSVVSREPGRLLRRRRRDARRAGHPGLDRHHQRQPHGPAGPLADRHRAARRGRAALREIAAQHHRACASPTTCSSASPTSRVRLLRADGAVIDQFDPDSETLRWAYDSGISDAQREGVKLTNLRLGEGVSGKAVAERRVITVGDYMAAEFQHDELADSLAGRRGPARPHRRPDHRRGRAARGHRGLQPDARTPSTTLDAAVPRWRSPSRPPSPSPTPGSSRSCERSQAALARRAETERSLRDITARIAALHDPDEVLERVVEDAKRLLEHRRRAPDPDGTRPATYLIPVVVAGGADASHATG